MLKYELRKLWLRPITLLLLLFVCAFHIVSIVTMPIVSTRKEDAYWLRQYEGVMNTHWQRSIQAKYQAFLHDESHLMSKEQFQDFGQQQEWSQHKIDKLYKDPENRLKEEIVNGAQYRNLAWAKGQLTFAKDLEHYVNVQKQAMLKKNPAFHTTRIDSLVHELRMHWDHYHFGYNYGWGVLQEGPVIMLRTYMLLMIGLLMILFAQEHTYHVSELQAVTKDGRRRLQKTKYKAAFLSGVLAWLFLYGVHAITTFALLGTAGSQTLVQDFLMNSCPYMLTIAQFDMLQAFISILAALVITLCMTVIAAYTRKSSTAMIVMFLLLMLPTFANNTPIQAAVILHPSNMLSARYLLSSISYVHILRWDILLPYAAFSVLLIVGCLSSYLLHRRKPESYFHISYGA